MGSNPTSTATTAARGPTDRAAPPESPQLLTWMTPRLAREATAAGRSAVPSGRAAT